MAMITDSVSHTESVITDYYNPYMFPMYRYYDRVFVQRCCRICFHIIPNIRDTTTTHWSVTEAHLVFYKGGLRVSQGIMCRADYQNVGFKLRAAGTVYIMHTFDINPLKPEFTIVIFIHYKT